MYQKSSVPIPAFPGKITRKKSADGSIYLYLEIDRTYHKDKGYTIPKRVCMGKQDPMDGSRMFPNEKYFEYFPSESTANTPEYSGSRSSCLHARDPCGRGEVPAEIQDPRLAARQVRPQERRPGHGPCHLPPHHRGQYGPALPRLCIPPSAVHPTDEDLQRQQGRRPAQGHDHP